MEKITYECLDRVNARFHNEFLEEFKNTLGNAQYILGDALRSFESNFSSYLQYDTKLHAAGVASGLDALTLALKALDLSPDDEVLLPANTYIATILSVLNNNLKPVLIDPDISTYNITIEGIKEFITPKTKVIIVVHLYGKMCNMEDISKFCKESNIILIEDVAQAHGSYLNLSMPDLFTMKLDFKSLGSASLKSNHIKSTLSDLTNLRSIRKAGSYGIACFSFYPTKNLGALGDGGMVVSENSEFIEKIKSLRNYGSNKKYYNDYLGVNSRLDSIQAGFLDIKLKYLDEMIAHKRALAKIYMDNLDERYIKPIIDDKYFDTYHIFNIRFEKRDELREHLLKNNIFTDIHYPIAPHKQVALKKYFDGMEFRNSETIHKTTLSLPISFGHREDEISRVVEVLNRF